MRKKTKVAFIFILVFSIIYTDQKDKNNARIKQINTQINQNNQKINKNSGEINKAKKDENVTTSQLRNIEAQIKKLQAEYDDAQKRYTDVLREIGKNDDEIRKDINEIHLLKLTKFHPDYLQVHPHDNYFQLDHSESELLYFLYRSVSLPL